MSRPGRPLTYPDKEKMEYVSVKLLESDWPLIEEWALRLKKPKATLMREMILKGLEPFREQKRAEAQTEEEAEADQRLLRELCETAAEVQVAIEEVTARISARAGDEEDRQIERQQERECEAEERL